MRNTVRVIALIVAVGASQFLAADSEIGTWADGPMRLVLRSDQTCNLVIGDIGFRCRFSVSSHIVTIAEFEDRGKFERLSEPYRFEYAPETDTLSILYKGARLRPLHREGAHDD